VNFTANATPPAVARTVSLSWNATASPNITGYNLYRATVAGGAFSKLNSSPLASTAYVDSGVTSGRIYYYVATAVDNNNQESPFSNQAIAAIP
jgi:fibronectin type 3 domain-containing protein